MNIPKQIHQQHIVAPATAVKDREEQLLANMLDVILPVHVRVLLVHLFVREGVNQYIIVLQTHH